MLIYGKAIQQFDYPGASVVALCNITLSLTLYALYRHLLTRVPS
jgi:2-aminoethylphosphonate transport system permease protein